MNRFRYDAIIRASWPRPPAPVRELRWHPAVSWTELLESGRAVVCGRADDAGVGVAIGLAEPGFCTVAPAPGDEGTAAALLPAPARR